MKFDYSNVKAPWLDSYDGVPPELEYSQKSMSEAVLEVAEQEKDFPALTFMGRKISFSRMAEEIELTARSFKALGVKPGQRVLVCLPNVPQAIYCLYGLNRIGAIASMVHPLSAVGEIVYYLNEAQCDIAVTLDQFYEKFIDVCKQRPVSKLIIARVSEELPFPLNIGQKIMTESKFPKLANDGVTVSWKEFRAQGVTMANTSMPRTTERRPSCFSPAAPPV